MSEPIHVISLGAGVQSSTMALMAEHGELQPMPTAAIFADTTLEPKTVYRWLDWLKAQLSFPVYMVSYGNLAERILRVQRSKKSGKLYTKTLIPVFIRKPNGTIGMLGRRCTKDYKINPIVRKTREIAGVPRGCKAIRVIQWIGISTDEAHRMKPASDPWIEHRWPLIERELTRTDCLKWMDDHGYPKPPRSACKICPYHSDEEWLRLKTEEPDEFNEAVEFEQDYQRIILQDEVTDGIPFLHKSGIPLDQVVFQIRTKSPDLFGNECEGICGV
jgi:hypothetical protein